MKAQIAGLVATRGVSGAAQALTLIFLARNASTAEFAAVSVVSGIAVFVCAFADLGLAGFVSKARARREDGLVLAALRLNLWSTLIFGVMFALCAAFVVPSDLVLALTFLSVGFFLEKNADTLLGVVIADGNKTVPTISIVGRRGFNLVGVILAVIFGWDVTLAYCLSYAVGGAFAQVIGARYVRTRLSGELSCEPLRQLIRRSSRFMWPFLAGQSRLLDAAVVTVLTGSDTAARYAAVTRLAQPVLIIPGAIGSIMLPHAARQPGSYARRIAIQLLAATAGLAVLCTPIAMFGSQIVQWLLGDSYGDTGPALGWSIYAILFLGVATPMTNALQGFDDEGFVVWSSLALAAVLLASVAAGTSMGGVTGGTIGFCFATFLRWFIYLVRLYWLRRSPH